MTVWNVDKNAEAKTMVITAEFRASITTVWQLWADPRLLERWWGPPTHPATVERHDLTVGGRVVYYMTSPEGERFYGLWDVTAVEAPASLEFTDAFADETGTPNDEMPASTAAMRLIDED